MFDMCVPDFVPASEAGSQWAAVAVRLERRDGWRRVGMLFRHVRGAVLAPAPDWSGALAWEVGGVCDWAGFSPRVFADVADAIGWAESGAGVDTVAVEPFTRELRVGSGRDDDPGTLAVVARGWNGVVVLVFSSFPADRLGAAWRSAYDCAAVLRGRVADQDCPGVAPWGPVVANGADAQAVNGRADCQPIAG